jgi:hypothetical protein
MVRIRSRPLSQERWREEASAPVQWRWRVADGAPPLLELRVHGDARVFEVTLPSEVARDLGAFLARTGRAC